MIKYEQLWERQLNCMVCYAMPPTEETNFECPFCSRVVTKEVSQEYWARTDQKYHFKRMEEFRRRLGLE